MRKNQTPAEVLEENRSILKELAAQPRAWTSATHLAWTIGGDEGRDRFQVYRVIEALAETGTLNSLTAIHNHRDLEIYDMDPEAITALLAGDDAEAVDQ